MKKIIYQLIPSFIILTGFICFVLRYFLAVYDKVLEDGRIYEPSFGFLPLGVFFTTIGVIIGLIYSGFKLYREKNKLNKFFFFLSVLYLAVYILIFYLNYLINSN